MHPLQKLTFNIKFKQMKKIITYSKGLVLALALMMSSTLLNAQVSGITIDASQQFSSFSYQNSEGMGGYSFLGSEDYQGIYSGGYNFGYRFVGLNNIVFRGSLGMRKAGAKLVYNDEVYTWSFQYIELRAAAGYKYDLDKLGIYMTAGPYVAYLLNGIQTLNDADYDLMENDEVNALDYGIIASPGVQYDVSDFINLYAEANYLFGLQNLEKGNAEQKSHNVGLAITLGVMFIIK